MKKIFLKILLFVILFVSGCEYSSAGAPINNGWIGNIENPYQGIVANNIYSLDNEGWFRLERRFNEGAKINLDDSLVIPNSVWTRVEYDLAIYDTDNILDDEIEKTLVIQTDGIYYFQFNALWSSNSTGLRGTILCKNGWPNGEAYVLKNADYGGYTGYQVVACVEMEQGDYMSVHLLQTSGGDLEMSKAFGGIDLACQKIGEIGETGMEMMLGGGIDEGVLEYGEGRDIYREIDNLTNRVEVLEQTLNEILKMLLEAKE